MEHEEVNLSAEAEEAEDQQAAGDIVVDGFDPTEDELVLHFLRPQLRGFPPRVAGAVLEADPCGAAPWELLARYGLREQGHFFAARGRRRPFVRRAVAGAGAWMHSSTRAGRSVTDLGVVVRWSRVKFCFYTRGGAGGAGAGQQRSTGWVMDEYEITDPGCYRRRDEEGEEDEYWVLCRVRKSKRPVPEAAKPASPPARQRWRKLAKLETDSGVKAKVSRPLRT
ncbi:hypothetical protein SEVIR_5G456300v4 [Setaria viridis]|uniref:NAC domain-containing protein n=1 Tax=Setaria viridis TaxID=4556 RepID=A0A4U6USU8_SETVI|nr:NAC domain-containing protein 2-like [Setaria viridis]TKW18812.1 hypothetical protein SEVIR_5G456300v2 [Setaria viridis]